MQQTTANVHTEFRALFYTTLSTATIDYKITQILNIPIELAVAISN